jgi:hypothetical protein
MPCSIPQKTDQEAMSPHNIHLCLRKMSHRLDYHPHAYICCHDYGALSGSTMRYSILGRTDQGRSDKEDLIVLLMRGCTQNSICS